MRLMRSLLAVALLALLSATATAKEEPDTVRARILAEEARKQYALGRFDDSLRAYREAFLAKPDALFLFNIAQCQRMLGRHKEAVFSYRRALDALPATDARRASIEQLVASEEEAIKHERQNLAPTGAISTTGPRPPELPLPKIEASPPAATPPPAVTPPPAASAPEAPPAAAETPTPLYKKWWLWTIVGAVVVAGVGAGVGVAVASPRDGSLDPNASTTLTVSF